MFGWLFEFEFIHMHARTFRKTLNLINGLTSGSNVADILDGVLDASMHCPMVTVYERDRFV